MNLYSIIKGAVYNYRHQRGQRMLTLLCIHQLLAERLPLSSLTHQATSITCHSCLALGLSSTTSTGWRGHTPWGGHLARSYTGREAVWHRASLVSSPLFLFKFCLEGKIGPGDIEGHSCQLPLHHNPCDIKVRSVWGCTTDRKGLAMACAASWLGVPHSLHVSMLSLCLGPRWPLAKSPLTMAQCRYAVNGWYYHMSNLQSDWCYTISCGGKWQLWLPNVTRPKFSLEWKSEWK